MVILLVIPVLGAHVLCGSVTLSHRKCSPRSSTTQTADVNIQGAEPLATLTTQWGSFDLDQNENEYPKRLMIKDT